MMDMNFEEFLTNSGKILEKATEIAETFNEAEFMLFMCMVVDEYHNQHRDFKSVEAIKKVAEMVEAVNEELGDYENN